MTCNTDQITIFKDLQIEAFFYYYFFASIQIEAFLFLFLVICLSLLYNPIIGGISNCIPLILTDKNLIE